MTTPEVGARIAERDIRRLMGRLSAIERQAMPNALANAINTVASEARKSTINFMSAKYGVARRKLGKRIKVLPRASARRLHGSVWMGVKFHLELANSDPSLHRVVHSARFGRRYSKGPIIGSHSATFEATVGNNHTGTFVRWRLPSVRKSPDAFGLNLPIQEVSGDRNEYPERISLGVEASVFLPRHVRHVFRNRFKVIFREKLNARVAAIRRRRR